MLSRRRGQEAIDAKLDEAFSGTKVSEAGGRPASWPSGRKTAFELEVPEAELTGVTEDAGPASAVERLR